MKLKEYMNIKEKYNPIMDNTKIEKELELMIKDKKKLNEKVSYEKRQGTYKFKDKNGQVWEKYKDNGMDWYIRKIDSTHIELKLDITKPLVGGSVYHIAQLKNKPELYNHIQKFVDGKEAIGGKIFENRKILSFKDYLNEITVIDFRKKLKDFKNINKLPDDVQKFMYREVDSFQSKGFQEILGHDKNNKIIIALGGYWDMKRQGKQSKGDKFVIDTWGINKKYIPKEMEVKNYTGRI